MILYVNFIFACSVGLFLCFFANMPDYNQIERFTSRVCPHGKSPWTIFGKSLEGTLTNHPSATFKVVQSDLFTASSKMVRSFPVGTQGDT